jgi:hypothetical protein
MSGNFGVRVPGSGEAIRARGNHLDERTLKGLEMKKPPGANPAA